MKSILSNWKRLLIVALLGMLGFASCEDEDSRPEMDYGVMECHFQSLD